MSKWPDCSTTSKHCQAREWRESGELRNNKVHVVSLKGQLSDGIISGVVVSDGASVTVTQGQTGSASDAMRWMRCDG